MRFYAMGYREVMELPIRAFWALSALVPRLRAEEALDRLRVATAAQSEEGVESLTEALLKDMGEPMKGRPVISAERDEEGVAWLKSVRF